MIARKFSFIDLAATAYVIVALAISAFFTPEPFPIVASALIVLQLISVLGSIWAGLKITLALVTLFLLPVILEPLVGAAISGIAAAPVLLMINQGLKDSSTPLVLQKEFKPGRHATSAVKEVVVALAVVFVASLILARVSIIIASSLLALDIAALLAYSAMKVPVELLDCTKTMGRVLTRNNLKVSAKMKSLAAVPMRVSLGTALPWVSLGSASFTLPAQKEVEEEISMTPPLAAPSRILVNATAADPWGVTFVNQVVEPVELHVIPRAAYAEWLARKYLEQTAPGYYPSMATPPLREARPSRRGVDYYGSRVYQPGDRIKDVDWRQTFKNQELVIKEFSGGQSQPAIIAVDLTAKDAENADKLAFDLITSALTMAKQGVPTAVTAFNEEGIVETTGVTDPREALKKAMALTDRIEIAEAPERSLGAVDVLRLRRNIALLGRSDGNGREKEALGKVLGMEYKSLQEGVRNMPPTLALKRAADKIPPPAAIIVVSSWVGDEDAFAINLKALKDKGYRPLAPEAAKKAVAC